MKKFLAAILILVLTGCSSVKDPRPTNGKPEPMNVTVSFYPLAYISQKVGGKLVKVTQITPGGVEPHDYEPTPQDLAMIGDSKIFVMSGYGIDAWADNVFANLNDTIAVKATSKIEMANTPNPDPHVWLNPINFSSEVEVIRDAFIKADPINTEKYKLNAAGLMNDLKALDREFREGLKECKLKQIITSHDAFHYMSSRYGFESFPIAGISPEEEPSPKSLATLSDLAKKNNIKYIFFETLVSTKLADTISEEVGAKSLVLNPIEGLTKEDSKMGKDYLVLMQENLKNLRTAMQCK